ncbi:thioredoxin family protein [Legionella pneumophila]|uniref:Thiol-disulfide isomerase and thioredoxins family n=1 Tax=Legionella pneumophila subsp. pascullei TaxID=91890 RepID=A0AAX2IVF6_LEGPN|nr:thioredoxin family protein [Legionella pneumophila]AMP89764.1 thioredoxin family protein [Legionella pneumophila subsp. pascullei]AMP92570.1 thioredoxin [Legionella pneumophila subsp. pascullei]AMP95536.1 thioredoxin [Legionella pneumophila subsp. pascullei]SQG90445.1 putative thiol-disulfide isomerase and thioredoxins family [Legionella pneumophila subsp. pascullei]VEH06722.1 putative thiol-disulfide isomerase and thioredoxins family [Legionella pneumophila subsp. pascullei]
MARTLSNMLPLGTVAPHFELVDVISGSKVKLRETPRYVATVIMFICNHCPFVKHINKELTRLANDYIPKGIRFLAINSNDIEGYPDDSPENMILTAKAHQYPFPYLYDETQEVAKAYNAACTPDFFVFDSDLSLAYRGQLDDSRPGNDIPVTGNSIRQALDYLLNNKPLDFEQKPSIGCNIKWKI